MGSLLNMNAVGTSGATLAYGGSELSVLVTFQVPVLSVSMAGSFAPTQLLSITSSLAGGASFFISLDAMFTGGNGGIVTAYYSYSPAVANGVRTTIGPSSPLWVAMPMLLGGWVTAAFSLSVAGVATLSVRDIFMANNATTSGTHRPRASSCCAGVLTRPEHLLFEQSSLKVTWGIYRIMRRIRPRWTCQHGQAYSPR